MITIETLYEIYPTIEKVERFKTGANQGTFKVSIGGDPFVLKVGSLDMYLYSSITPLLLERGVLTPKVFEIGRHKDLDYVLMEYIEGTNLSAESVDKGTFKSLALMMKKLHTIKGKGYGKMVGGVMKGEFVSFSEYLQNGFLKGIELNEKNLSFHLDRIEESIEKDDETVFCHMDFSTNNILQKGSELYLIDYGNEAGLNSPIMDIAKAIVNDSRYGEDVINAYYEENDFDLELLYSFVYIVGLRKIVSWRKRGKDERVEDLLKLFGGKVEFE